MLQKYLALSIFLIAIFCCAWRPPQKTAMKSALTRQTHEIGSQLPQFKFYFPSQNKYITDENIHYDGHLIIMLFNPTCSHCEEQAEIFKANIDRAKRSKLLLVAAASMKEYLDYFKNNTRIGDVSKMPVGLDSSGYLDLTFRYVTLPQLNIYDNNRKLVKVFFGVTTLDSLSAFLD